MKTITKLTAAALIAFAPAVTNADDFKEMQKEKKTEQQSVTQETRSQNIPGLGQSDTQQIKKGVRKEELTETETSELNAQRGQLDTTYSNAQADGTITKEERTQLRGEVKDYRAEIKSESRD